MRDSETVSNVCFSSESRLLLSQSVVLGQMLSICYSCSAALSAMVPSSLEDTCALSQTVPHELSPPAAAEASRQGNMAIGHQ